jgi:hypothetical protein
MNEFEYPEVLVIDDFHQDPFAIRKIALESNFKVPPNQEIGGGVGQKATCPSHVYDITCGRFKSIFDGHVFISPKQMLFRYSINTTIPKTVCHTDEGKRNWDWSAIVYLTLPQDCRGGTDFFKHKTTGSLGNDGGFDWQNADHKNPRQWQRIEHIEMKFNRCVLFRAYRFHSAGQPFFGDNIENGRLTQAQRMIAGPC